MGKYDHIDFSPPAGVRKAAAKGLEWRKEFGRGGTAVGVARARDLSNGKNVSPETAKRMKSYFARHEVDKEGEGWNPGEEGYPSAGKIAWYLWGSDAGKAWSNKLVRQIEAADEGERMAKRRNTYADNSKLVMRMVRVGETQSDGSIEVVVASENPVERYDYRREEVVKEILRMKGVEFRTTARQLPIVDSHDASTVANVLGSVRDLKVQGDELIGRAMFADDEDSQIAYRKLLDGHLTDFSITATPNEVTYVRRGENVRVGKQRIDGPAEIVERWRPLDASLVAVGADERSTVRSELRRSYETLRRDGVDDMLAIKLLQKLGMPKDITERSAIEEWVDQNISDTALLDPESEADASPAMSDELPDAAGDSSEEAAAEASEDASEDAGEQQEEEQQEESADDSSVEESTESDPAAVVDRAISAERTRQRSIRDLASKFNIERAVVDKWCENGIDLKTARKQVVEIMAQQNAAAGSSVDVTRSAVDKTLDAVRSGLIQRCYQTGGVQRRSEESNANDLQYAGLLRMAEMVLRSGGINTERMAPRDIAMLAMGHEGTVQRMNIRRDSTAYHVTGSFQNLMLDASNKTLLAAYEEAPFTWNTWARQAQSVPDFRDINRIRFSEAPDLDVVPENTDYREGSMSDAKEKYSVEKFGRIFTVSWETIINDDLDAISRVPAMQGNAARRTQNKKVYEVLTANAAMADGNALFSSAHGNLDASGAAPSVAELNAAYTGMMTQTGLSGEIINVEPSVIIAPPSLRGTVLQLLGSFSDPAAGGTNAGNANSLNIHQNVLQAVIEPQLEANSSTAWYLAASPARIDTVEIAFLQGEESPVLESEYNFNKDCYHYKVRQTFGVSAIDYRGLWKNPGA